MSESEVAASLQAQLKARIEPGLAACGALARDRCASVLSSSFCSSLSGWSETASPSPLCWPRLERDEVAARGLCLALGDTVFISASGVSQDEDDDRSSVSGPPRSDDLREGKPSAITRSSAPGELALVDTDSAGDRGWLRCSGSSTGGSASLSGEDTPLRGEAWLAGVSSEGHGDARPPVSRGEWPADLMAP